MLTAYASLATAGFIVAAAGTVALFNAKAFALADLSLALVLARLPLGLAPHDDVARLRGAFATAVVEPATAEACVARIARAEPLAAGRSAYLEGMRAHAVRGWRRHLNPDACELCTWWARDGQVFPVSRKMPQHPGCGCTAIPVTEEA